jgi:hypothetical protein
MDIVKPGGPRDLDRKGEDKRVASEGLFGRIMGGPDDREAYIVAGFVGLFWEEIGEVCWRSHGGPV